MRTSIRFVILQHPLERRRSVGSARMAHLCVDRSIIRVGAGEEFDRDEVIQSLIHDPANHCVVLYPGPDARNISRSPSVEWLPAGKALVVFVIDGTWSCAKSMLRRSLAIRSLPQISFDADRRSEYRFRKQPDARCLSTLEAIHEVLSILDPSSNAEVLMELFRAMVKRQVSFQEPGVPRSVSRSAPEAHGEPSPALRTPPAT